MNKKWVAFVILFFLFSPFFGQQSSPTKLKKEILKSKKQQTQYTPPAVGVVVLNPAPPVTQTKKSLAYLDYSDDWYQDNEKRPNVQVLKGNVKFRYDDMIMFCDSAYYNEKANTFDAFSNVRIVQGDTLTVYGELLNYDGNTKLAQLQHNVKMVNRNTVLTTETLYYDRISNLAYYYTGGEVKDGNNVLTSMWGQYSPDKKIALFKDGVEMESPDGTMTADTLKYYTDTSIADIVGNSHITYKDETDVYSEKGWYDTKKERMMLLERSLIEQKDGKTLVGDTIFYDKKSRFGEAFSKVELNDPEQKATLYGNYLSYDEVTEIGLAADSALFVDWSRKDKQFSLSADTLYTLRDSVATDSVAYNSIKAYSNARFYRVDFQGMCDTLTYTTRDSIMRLKSIPVVWSDNNQLKGKRINAFIKNKRVDHIKIEELAIAIQKDSLNYYNQLAGKEIVAYLDTSGLRRVDVNGNVETIYFPKDDKTKEFIGVNKTISSFAKMYVKDEKLDRIVLTAATNATMYPLIDMEKKDLYLPDFHWFEKERPLRKEDVFSKFKRVEIPRLPDSDKKPSIPGSKSEKDDSRGNSRAKNKSKNRTNNLNNRNSLNQQNNGNRSSFGGNLKPIRR